MKLLPGYYLLLAFAFWPLSSHADIEFKGYDEREITSEPLFRYSAVQLNICCEDYLTEAEIKVYDNTGVFLNVRMKEGGVIKYFDWKDAKVQTVSCTKKGNGLNL